ncbi:MAG: S8 family serine peptidase [Thermodesulfobacteriota bacterium]
MLTPRQQFLQTLSRRLEGLGFQIFQFGAVLLILAIAMTLLLRSRPLAVAEPEVSLHIGEAGADTAVPVPISQPAAASADSTDARPAAAPMGGKPAGPVDAADILDKLAANRQEYGVLPDDYLLRFKTLADFRAFLEKAVRAGLTVRDSSEGLLTVRFTAASLAEWRELLNEFDPADMEYTIEYALPGNPDPALLPALAGYQGFGNGTLAWLGVKAVSPDWGKGVVVAVLDTQIMAHSALNPGHFRQIDLRSGSDPGTGEYAFHGTAVASLIAGDADNIHGLAPGVDILSIPVLDSNGYGDALTLAKAITAAVDNGADIINMSLGSYGDSKVVRQAIAYATDKGVVMVASTGNDGLAQATYPAGYDGVIGVGGVDLTSRRLDFSNYGPHTDIMGPAQEVWAAGPNNGTASFTGTSAATPHVAGSIAAILSENGEMTAREAERLVLTYTNDAGPPGPDEVYGTGNLNIGQVINRNTPGIVNPAVADIFLPDAQMPAAGTTLPGTINIQNRGTVPVAKAIVNVEINGIAQTYPVYDLAPNTSAPIDISIPAEQILPTGTPIRATLTASDPMDSKPGDNIVSDTLFLAAAATPAAPARCPISQQ